MSKLVLNGNTSGSVTLDAPAVSGTTTLTLPTTSGTVVADSATQTLTNKTLTSPILTTPALGTPSALVLTNATGLPASALPAGSVLQVVQTVKTDTYSAAPGSTTWADITGMSVSITPSSASNKIMVFMSVIGGTGNLSYIRLVRDSTAIGIGDTAGSRVRSTMGNFNNSSDGNTVYSWSTNFLDSPATTSSTTYKLQLLGETTNTFYLNRTVADTNSTAGFRPISQITVMEIKG
jgi:hypothetical protein